jgi:hypothetical protein
MREFTPEELLSPEEVLRRAKRLERVAKYIFWAAIALLAVVTGLAGSLWHYLGKIVAH